MLQFNWNSVCAFIAAVIMCLCLGLTIIKGIMFVFALLVFMTCIDTIWRESGY